MLHITVDIVPFGNEALRRRLGDVKIANQHTDHENVGHYHVELEADLMPATTKKSTNLRYARSRGWLGLVARALTRLEGR